jgi:condensin complex subunit 3
LCKDNIIVLLQRLDVGNSDGKIASDTLSVLFKNIPYKELVQNFQYVDENRLVPYDKLTAETAIYWKCLTKFLFTEGGGAIDFLERLLPELSRFCAYIRHYVIELEKPSYSEDVEDADATWAFIARQLIEMVNVFDLADEVGRANLGNLCKDLMASRRVTAAFIEPLMTIFTVIRSNQGRHSPNYYSTFLKKCLHFSLMFLKFFP